MASDSTARGRGKRPNPKIRPHERPASRPLYNARVLPTRRSQPEHRTPQLAGHCAPRASQQHPLLVPFVRVKNHQQNHWPVTMFPKHNGGCCNCHPKSSFPILLIVTSRRACHLRKDGEKRVPSGRHTVMRGPQESSLLRRETERLGDAA